MSTGVFLIVWLSQWLLWVLFANNAGAHEIAIGAMASALATSAVVRFQGRLKDRFHLSTRDALQVRHTPVLVASDTRILFRVIGLRLLERDVPGGVATVHFTLGGDDPNSRGRRALATTFLTITPNTLVLGFLSNEQELFFHTLIPQKLPSFLFKMDATLQPKKRTQP
jgi:multisubunit Na+/H+ antiporter MnhE subunit